MIQAINSKGNVEMPSSDVKFSNEDLYALDLPLSLASRMPTPNATSQHNRIMEIRDTQHEKHDTLPEAADDQPDHVLPEPLGSPSFAKPESWYAIDAATAERRANIQAKLELTKQDIAAQELRALKRGLELREGISRTAFTKVYGQEPLVIPKSWSVSEAPLQRLAEHPFLFDGYLNCEQCSLDVIKVRRTWLPFQIRDAPQIRARSRFQRELQRLALVEKDIRDIQASRLLVDLILRSFQHILERLLADIEKDDITDKTPLSDLCLRLLSHSTHPDGDDELLAALHNILDMEREYMPWRYSPLDTSLNTSPTSSMENPSPAVESPPAAEICLSPERLSSPTPPEDSPLKDPRRLRVQSEEPLPTRSSGTWRMPRQGQPTSSPNSIELPSYQSLQCESSAAMPIEERSHDPNTEMRHLTHPIVMMATITGHYLDHAHRFQPTSSEQRQPVTRRNSVPPCDDVVMSAPATTEVSSGPINPGALPNPFVHRESPKPAPTRPEAARLPESSLIHNRPKRRASEELTSPSDHGMKWPRLPCMRRNNTEGQYVRIEDRNTDVEMGNTARSVREPTPRMKAALAEAHKKREERQRKEREDMISGRALARNRYRKIYESPD